MGVGRGRDADQRLQIDTKQHRYIITSRHRNIDTCYNQRADQYKVIPGMCECAATAEAAEQGGGRGVGLVRVPCHGGS